VSDPNLDIEQTSAAVLLKDPATSKWLKSALQWALERDPVDAFQDSLALAGVLEERLRAELGLDELP
jgi:hypothetical protein